MLVYEAIGHTLQRLGVDTIFGLTGDGNLRFSSYMADELGIRLYAARHEGGAVAMADGYARVSGRVGVASVTQGPGVTNTLTALTEAVRGNTPLLLLAGETPTGQRKHNKDLDQPAVYAALGAGVQPLHGPDQAVRDVAQAFNRARLESRPIAISFPGDMQGLECRPDGLERVRPLQAPASQPDAGSIERLCELIARAERPAILAGRGAVRSAAREALVGLAERIGAILATTAQAKGLFAGDPFYIGSSGCFASPVGSRLLAQADLVLAFGASLTLWTTRNREQYAASARLVQIDLRPAALGAVTPVDEGFIGDARATAEALAGELADRGLRKEGFRTPAVAQEIAGFRLDVFEDRSNGRTVDPRAVMIKLDRMLPRERTVVIDSGHSMGWAPIYMSVPDAAAFVFSNDFMAVGLGLGNAFGAAIARPDRLTVVTPGDGGTMMSLGEVETFVRYDVPALIVVINDAAYGPEVHMLRAAGKSPEHALFGDVNFAAVACALGAQGLTIRDASQLDQLGEWLARPRGPMVVDCKVDPLQCADWLAALLEPGSWYRRLADG